MGEPHVFAPCVLASSYKVDVMTFGVAKRTLVTKSLVGCLLVLAACGEAEDGTALDSEPSEVHVQLSLPTSGVVRYTLRNDSSEAVSVKGWDVSSLERLVNVSQGGKPLAYTGIMVTSLPQAHEEVVAVPAGGSLSRDIPVAQNFEVVSAGTVQVQENLDAPLELVGSTKTIAHSAESLSTAVSPAAQQTGDKAVSYPCNAAQLTAVKNAKLGATWLADFAIDNLLRNDQMTRMRRWFGNFASYAPIELVLTRTYWLAKDAVQES